MQKLQNEIDEVTQKYEAEKARANAHKKDLEQKRTQFNDLKEKLTELTAKDGQIKALREENARLLRENEETQKRQQLLEAELEKAEAQAELIKELLFANDEGAGESEVAGAGAGAGESAGEGGSPAR